MEHSILDSVIKITNQRDVDSLEYSLIATLIELVNIDSIEFYKLVEDGLEKKTEKILSVSRSDNNQYQWQQAPESDLISAQVIRCMESGHLVKPNRGQANRVILPISHNNSAVAAIDIRSRQSLARHLDLLQGMIKVYENYLYILNESERDKLTGLFNRRTFDKKLDRLLQLQRNKQAALLAQPPEKELRMLRPNSQAWMAIIDVDHFKQVNDSYGHVFGDGVLLLLAQKMKQCFRQTDYLFRFGGEEFVVILEPHPAELARATLNRFCRSIREHRFPLVGKVTVSIGYAQILQTDYPPSILHSADKALYFAKDNGRDQVCNYEHLVEAGEIQKTQMGREISIN